MEFSVKEPFSHFSKVFDFVGFAVKHKLYGCFSFE
jgi:hypothetical protein